MSNYSFKDCIKKKLIYRKKYSNSPKKFFDLEIFFERGVGNKMQLLIFFKLKIIKSLIKLNYKTIYFKFS